MNRDAGSSSYQGSSLVGEYRSRSDWNGRITWEGLDMYVWSMLGLEWNGLHGV